MLSLCLNFRPARSADRKQNWLPYSSISICGPSRTVAARCESPSPLPLFVPKFVPESPPASSVLYKGTANAKTDPCFGKTVAKKGGEGNERRWVDKDGNKGRQGRADQATTHAPFDLFFRVTTLNVFSVSCTTIPDAPTSAAFLLLRTISNIVAVATHIHTMKKMKTKKKTK